MHEQDYPQEGLIMKMAKKMILAAVVLPLTLGTASAWAFDGKGGEGHHGGEFGKCASDRGIFKELNLTDAQKDQLKTMREQGRQEMRAKFAGNNEARQAEMQAYHAQVQQLLLADNFDQAQANTLAKQMVEKQTERRVQMMARQHKMLSVLTPEQKTQYAELKQERMQECQAKMHERMQKRAEQK